MRKRCTGRVIVMKTHRLSEARSDCLRRHTRFLFIKSAQPKNPKHKMCHASHTSEGQPLAAITKDCPLHDAPAACARREDAFAPPPPAKFSRRKAGAEQSSQKQRISSQSNPALQQQLRRGTYESIIASELYTFEVIAAQDDIWASIEPVFWQ